MSYTDLAAMNASNAYPQQYNANAVEPTQSFTDLLAGRLEKLGMILNETNGDLCMLFERTFSGPSAGMGQGSVGVAVPQAPKARAEAILEQVDHLLRRADDCMGQARALNARI